MVRCLCARFVYPLLLSHVFTCEQFFHSPLECHVPPICKNSAKYSTTTKSVPSHRHPLCGGYHAGAVGHGYCPRGYFRGSVWRTVEGGCRRTSDLVFEWTVHGDYGCLWGIESCPGV